MADLVMGTNLLNHGLGFDPRALGLQWQALKQAGVDDAAAWDAIRNVSVLEEQNELRRVKNDPGPDGATAYWTGWNQKHKAAVKAREERLERLLKLQNPYRAPAAAA